MTPQLVEGARVAEMVRAAVEAEREAARAVVERTRAEEQARCIFDVCSMCALGSQPLQTHPDMWVHRVATGGEIRCGGFAIRRRAAEEASWRARGGPSGGDTR